MLCPACLVVLSVAAANQLVNNVALGHKGMNYIVSKQSISLDIYGLNYPKLTQPYLT